MKQNAPDYSNLRWSEKAILLAVGAMILSGTDAFEPAAYAGEISTVACYVALAYDLTPLVDAALPDSVAASPECASAQQDDDKNREANVARSKLRNAKAATKGNRPAPANADNRLNGPGATPQPSLQSTKQRASQQ
ncbi:MAG TPA: hypothetical protein VEO36_00075 [Casimicrobiaceae bacterium]|nr:hypothetical protein [Casimicrobiaceae bacterium]